MVSQHNINVLSSAYALCNDPAVNPRSRRWYERSSDDFEFFYVSKDVCAVDMVWECATVAKILDPLQRTTLSEYRSNAAISQPLFDLAFYPLCV